jgi:hypothetical protein
MGSSGSGGGSSAGGRAAGGFSLASIGLSAYSTILLILACPRGLTLLEGGRSDD